MSDLSTMYGGSPNTASMMMGQNQYDDRQQKAATLQALMMKNQQDAALNPIEQQLAQGKVAAQAASLPGIQGQSQSLAAQGQVDSGTVQAKLTEKLSDIATHMGENGIKQMGQDAEKMQQVGVILSKYPAAAHKEIFHQFMQAHGGDSSNPLVQGLDQMPDDQFARAVGEIGTAMATTGTKFTQERTLQKDRTDSAASIQKAHDNSREEVARTQAEARKQVAEQKFRLAMTNAKIKPEEAIASILMIPEEDRTPDMWKSLNALEKHVYTSKALAANATTADVLGKDNPIAAAQKAADANSGHAAPTASSNDPAAFAKANGLPYDLSKFKYRMVNGKLQSAPK